MARSLSDVLFKGVARIPITHYLRTTVSGYYHYGIKYSTTVTSDSDTDEDSKPTAKLTNSGLSIIETIEKDVKENPVVIYMKGHPGRHCCGYSSMAVRLLKIHKVPITARDVEDNDELKAAVKAYSNHPTFPQIFIKGEFLGGVDFLLDLQERGELQDKLEGISQSA